MQNAELVELTRCKYIIFFNMKKKIDIFFSIICEGEVLKPLIRMLNICGYLKPHITYTCPRLRQVPAQWRYSAVGLIVEKTIKRDVKEHNFNN